MPAPATARFLYHLIFSGLILFATIPTMACAGEPNKTASRIDNVLVGSPNGYARGGSPPGFDVLVRDSNNIPLSGVTVKLEFGSGVFSLYSTQNSGTTVICVPPRSISRVTDGLGEVKFAARFGGGQGTEIAVIADGVPLGSAPSRTPDYDGNGQTGVSDFSKFTTHFFSGNPLSDFDESGSVGVGDLSIFASEYFWPAQALCP